MSSLQEQFQAAVKEIQSGQGNFKPSNDLKLKFYGLFKQATEGDVSGKKPGMMDVVGRMKYGAWEDLKGTSKEKAMQTYLDEYNKVKKTI